MDQAAIIRGSEKTIQKLFAGVTNAFGETMKSIIDRELTAKPGKLGYCESPDGFVGDLSTPQAVIRGSLDKDFAGKTVYVALPIADAITLAGLMMMTPDEVIDQRHVLPGVRFAVDAYLNFARRATWQEAACSSLTELFAPEIHQSRLDSWPAHYPWIEESGYSYFRKRLSEARRDVEHGLTITLDHFNTEAQQARALEILQFKLDILWTMLDAMTMAYGHLPDDPVKPLQVRSCAHFPYRWRWQPSVAVVDFESARQWPEWRCFSSRWWHWPLVVKRREPVDPIGPYRRLHPSK